MSPAITVLMPVYNSQKYLQATIDSILKQTFTDFEYLIIDDGSTDNSLNIINQYHDPRIVLIQNPHNLGQVPSMNNGLDIARGKYIARIDADDIALPERIEKQFVLMEAHPQIGLAGTNYLRMDEKGRLQLRPVHPISWKVNGFAAIRWALLWHTTLCHPSVMIRRSILEDHHLRYDNDFAPSEDYQLWTQICRVSEVVSLPEVLTHYRINSEGLSLTHRQIQKNALRQIVNRELENLLQEKLPDNLFADLYSACGINRDPLVQYTFPEISDLYLKILDRYKAIHQLTRAEIQGVHLRARWIFEHIREKSPNGHKVDEYKKRIRYFPRSLPRTILEDIGFNLHEHPAKLTKD